MSLNFTLTCTFQVSPKKIYNAWLSSKEHSEMTGSESVVSNQIDGEFSAFDGYAIGKNLILEPYSKIVQSWRTTEFSDDEEDSILEIVIESKGKDTILNLHHYNLPPHGSTYEQGWIDFYFEPMKVYFSE